MSSAHSLGQISDNMRDFRRSLFSKKHLFLLFFIIGLLAGVAFFFFQSPKYTAETSFILEEKQSGLGGLGGLASQFGFDIGSIMSGGSLFSGDNILDILKSKAIVYKVLLSPDGTDISSTSLANRYLAYSGMRMKWSGNSVLSGIQFPANQEELSVLQDSVLNIIYEKLQKKNISVERMNRKGSIIKVAVTSKDRVFARTLSDRLVEEASKMYLDIKIGMSQANISQLQKRSDSLLALLNSKTYSIAATQTLDGNPGIKTATVHTEIASRDKTVIATLYSEVTKNLEIARLMLAQQTPVIHVLDRPGYGLFDNKKSLLFSMTAFSIVFFLLSVGGSSLIWFLKRGQES